MSDLVSGRYSQQELFWRILGMPQNATQSDFPVSTNLTLFGLAGLTDAAQAATKKGWAVAIPVSEGYYYTKVGIIVGATEGEAGKTFAAVYEGTTGKKEAKLLAQSAKALGESALTKEKLYSLELEKGVLANPETAPHGYLFAGIVQEATTIGTAITQAAVKAIAQKLNRGVGGNGPEVLATAITAKGPGEAPAMITTETAVETVPIVFLY
jgi:hypothetical protein